MSECDHRPEVEADLEDECATELARGDDVEEESMDEVRRLIVGDELAALERRIAFLETRMEIEVGELRRSVVRSTELLMEVLRQEIRDLASRIEAGTPRHTEAMERFWATASKDEKE